MDLHKRQLLLMGDWHQWGALQALQLALREALCPAGAGRTACTCMKAPEMASRGGPMPGHLHQIAPASARLPVSAGQQKTLVVRDTRSGAERQVSASIVVNAAGLFAQRVSKQLLGVPGATIPQCHYARGHYCTLKGEAPSASSPAPFSSFPSMVLTVAVYVSFHVSCQPTPHL